MLKEGRGASFSACQRTMPVRVFCYNGADRGALPTSWRQRFSSISSAKRQQQSGYQILASASRHLPVRLSKKHIFLSLVLSPCERILPDTPSLAGWPAKIVGFQGFREFTSRKPYLSRPAGRDPTLSKNIVFRKADWQVLQGTCQYKTLLGSVYTTRCHG